MSLLDLYDKNPNGREFVEKLQKILSEIKNFQEQLMEKIEGNSTAIKNNSQQLAELINKPETTTAAPKQKVEFKSAKEMANFFILDFTQNMAIWQKEFKISETVPVDAWNYLKKNFPKELKAFAHERANT